MYIRTSLQETAEEPITGPLVGVAVDCGVPAGKLGSDSGSKIVDGAVSNSGPVSVSFMESQTPNNSPLLDKVRAVNRFPVPL